MVLSNPGRRTFSLDVKVGESVSIDRGRVIATLVEKSGQRAKLAFDAVKDAPVNRVSLNFHTGASQARKGISTA